MYRTQLRLAVLAIGCLGVVGLHTTPNAFAQAQQTVRLEPNLAVSVEMFCSDTKLRTTNARIRWSVSGETLKTIGVTSLQEVKQGLDVTVYKNGFDKGLLVTLPISPAPLTAPVTPQAVSAQVRADLRAFQIQLIEIEQPRPAVAAESGSEMGIVVENLEPGVGYTFRLAVDTPAGRVVSPPVTSEAAVCPADMVPSTAAPREKK